MKTILTYDFVIIFGILTTGVERERVDTQIYIYISQKLSNA